MSTFGPFLGLNNRLPDTKLAVKDKGQYLRQAINVDLDDSGWVRRRKGYESIASIASPHSLWSNGVRTFLVQGGALREVLTFSPFVEVSRLVLTTNTPMRFVSVGGDVYFTNGTDSGRLAAGSVTVAPWALATPSAPVLSVGVGALHPGEYRVALTYTNSDGVEGGSTAHASIELVEESGIIVGLPTAGSSGATHINIYVSAAHGEVPCWHSMVAIGTSSATIATQSTLRAVPNVHLQPQPPGQLVGEFNGRLLVASDNTLTYSPSWNHGLYHPARDIIPFHSSITNIVPCEAGVYVTAEKTYWLAGPDIANADLSQVLPYGAMEGTAFTMPQTRQVGWYGTRGIVVGNEMGEVKAVQEEAVATATAATACALLREEDGVRSVLVLFSGTTDSPDLVAPGVAYEDSVGLDAV